MLEYVKLGYAAVMRDMWLALNRGNTTDEYYFFTGMLTPRTIKLKEGRSPRIADMSAYSVIRMPQNNHLFEVLPMGEGCTDGGEPIPMVQPAEGKFYKGAEYAGIPYFEPRGGKLFVYNVGECITELEVTALWDDEDSDIPADLGFNIIKSVLKDVFGVKEIDRVKIDDNSNAFIHQLKSQLGMAATQ